jgi:hypothetical protein
MICHLNGQRITKTKSGRVFRMREAEFDAMMCRALSAPAPVAKKIRRKEGDGQKTMKTCSRWSNPGRSSRLLLPVIPLSRDRTSR